MKDLIIAATSGLFVEVGKIIEHMKAQQARIADLERQLAEASAPAVEQAVLVSAVESRLKAMVNWLETHQPDVFRRGIWDAINSAAVKQAFPERDLSKPAEQQGIFRKFDVRRVDGSDAPGGKHHGCAYFVLDLDHDAHAPAAMHAYGLSCASTHPELSREILAKFAAPPAADTDKVREALNGLHNDIMNLPHQMPITKYAVGTEAFIAYKEGHRDARHAAAELVASMAGDMG